MGTRGRQSAASLGVVPIGPRPAPPPPMELTADQAVIWREVAAQRPPTWFTADTFPLLVAYCRLVTDARDIEALIQGIDLQAVAENKETLDRYRKLIAMRCQIAAGLASLATKMRLSQQSRYN